MNKFFHKVYIASDGNIVLSKIYILNNTKIELCYNNVKAYINKIIFVYVSPPRSYVGFVLKSRHAL